MLSSRISFSVLWLRWTWGGWAGRRRLVDVEEVRGTFWPWTVREMPEYWGCWTTGCLEGEEEAARLRFTPFPV